MQFNLTANASVLAEGVAAARIFLVLDEANSIQRVGPRQALAAVAGARAIL